MTLKPENEFIVEVTPDDEIVCRPPASIEQRIKVADIGSVFFQTGDGGAVGIDWWLLNDANGKLALAFPLGATGEQAVLDRLCQLPGFKIDGMNSTENARFRCWQASTT